ncbi:MAG TPA: hypothetical protein VGP47_00260, partial [Parachlamydiaceae bacterium]|nr:hypothetical protein [Parachlamydiaceae bacterium]
MNLLTLIKKSAFILSIVPLLSVATLYAGQADVIARGEHRGAATGHHQLANPGAAHHELNHGMENRGAYDRGVEAGAVGGAAVD